jgi:hypothetical protein
LPLLPKLYRSSPGAVMPLDTAEIKGLRDTYPRRVKQDVDPRP